MLPPGTAPARVTTVHRGACDVVAADGPRRLAVDRSTGEPATGDWCAVAGDRPAALLPRRTCLVRSSVSGRSHTQVLAANVDTVVVVLALDDRPALSRVERFLTLAWESGARPLLALSKADLVADPAPVLRDVAVAAPGVDVVPVSAETGAGLDALRAALTGTVVLIGSSGAGKSTLANALLGTERFATGDVRAVDGKGRHTTVHRELAVLGDGLCLVDTPGLRSVGVAGGEEGLERVFADLDEFAVDCRFSDCGHRAEPGCAVLAAIEAGLLSARRLDSYRTLVREQQHFEARTDARLRAERLRAWKVVAKQQRAHRPRP
ncbi:ribosome small subunit-dependent GTPase A [Kineosporiaceae bacterium B12]|nr:ribosome small subunit-dependent GTPase A [Kineococcus rubinsiae]